jgi:uncharacterized damage-inducible protein DinB
MPMSYPEIAIPETEVPRAIFPFGQHLVSTYASETNKVASVWRAFEESDFGWRPHARSNTVGAIMKHQLLSERRFFAEFLGLDEVPAEQVLPASETRDAYRERFLALARPRLSALAAKSESWWIDEVPFFDVRRQRIWVFWRRVLHTAHHRAQLGVYLRLLDRHVPAVYGPTADVTWQGADPTQTVDAAKRK